MITLKESVQRQVDRLLYEIELDIYGTKIHTNYNYFIEQLVDRIVRFTYTGRQRILEDIGEENLDWIWENQNKYTFGEERTDEDKDIFVHYLKLDNEILTTEFAYFPLRKLDEYNEKSIVDYSHFFNVEQGIPNIAFKDTEESKKLEILNEHFIHEKHFGEVIPWKRYIKKHLLDQKDPLL